MFTQAILAGDGRFESSLGHWLPWLRFSVFSLPFQPNSRTVPWNTSRFFPSTSFIILLPLTRRHWLYLSSWQPLWIS